MVTCALGSAVAVHTRMSSLALSDTGTIEPGAILVVWLGDERTGLEDLADTPQHGYVGFVQGHHFGSPSGFRLRQRSGW
jgi:hypothetical protein